MDDLRSRQRALASGAILDACADLVTERHHLDFSMKEVADRAGVSLRTVYNHFASREDLLDAMGRTFDEQMKALGGASAQEVGSRGDLVRAVRTNLRVFDRLGELSEAFAQLPLADVGRDAERAGRTRALVDLLAGFMPGVPEADARRIALVLRHLASHRSWFWLTHEYDLSTDQVADVVTWAIETLIDAAVAGDLPSPTEDS